MSTQPQLLQIPLDPGDVVYTPDWVAKDMVEFFRPTGRILEPCKGDGVFLKYLPGNTEWCEISEGRDFFAWTEQVDWVFGNPPYATFYEWLMHSFRISKNIVYLVPVYKCFTGDRTIRAIQEYGGIVNILYYGSGRKIGLPFGLALGAIHIKRNYTGPMYTTIAERAE